MAFVRIDQHGTEQKSEQQDAVRITTEKAQQTHNFHMPLYRAKCLHRKGNLGGFEIEVNVSFGWEEKAMDVELVAASS